MEARISWGRCPSRGHVTPPSCLFHRSKRAIVRSFRSASVSTIRECRRLSILRYEGIARQLDHLVEERGREDRAAELLADLDEDVSPFASVGVGRRVSHL